MSTLLASSRLLVALLEKTPGVEKLLKAKTEALTKTLTSYLSLAEIEQIQLTPDYAKLNALFKNHETKAQFTPKLLQTYGLNVDKVTASTIKSFLIKVIQAKQAAQVLQEIAQAPRQKTKLQIAQLANLKDKKRDTALAALSPKELTEICLVAHHKNIPTGKSKKAKEELVKMATLVVEKSRQLLKI